MGCGSSSAAPVDSTPIVPQDMHNQKGGKGKQQAQAHPPPIGGATAANSSQGKRASGGGLAGDGDQSAAAAVAAATPPPAPKEKQKMKRLTEDQHAAPSSSSPAAVASAPACDSDASHDATVWCAQCEQRFCSSCDVAAHQPGPARKHQHQRSTLKGSSGGAAKSKFVLKSTAAPAAGSSADASADDDASRMFQVGKFAHAEGTNGGGGGSTHHIDTAPSKDAADMDTSVGLRLKHAKKGAVLNALGEDELSRMNRYELELLWHKYDKDKNLVLNREELKALAADVIARVLKLIEDDLVKHNPGLTPQQIEEQIEEEKAFVLPGKNRVSARRHHAHAST